MRKILMLTIGLTLMINLSNAQLISTGFYGAYLTSNHENSTAGFELGYFDNSAKFNFLNYVGINLQYLHNTESYFKMKGYDVENFTSLAISFEDRLLKKRFRPLFGIESGISFWNVDTYDPMVEAPEEMQASINFAAKVGFSVFISQRTALVCRVRKQFIGVDNGLSPITFSVGLEILKRGEK